MELDLHTPQQGAARRLQVQPRKSGYLVSATNPAGSGGSPGPGQVPGQLPGQGPEPGEDGANFADVKQLGLVAALTSLSYVFWICGGMEVIERLA